jgi:uncharacterized membrane protein
MGKTRIEAFSDGVLAIVITVMVLEFKIPSGAGVNDLLELGPEFLSYVLSFIYIGIYWNNHHHLFHAIDRVSGRVLWANLHLLFWLSLVPITTGWIARHGSDLVPVVIYGVILLLAAIAYFILVRSLLKIHGPDSTVAKAMSSDFKGKISIAIYLAGIASCFIYPWLGYIFYSAVAAIWLMPDRRIEEVIENR